MRALFFIALTILVTTVTVLAQSISVFDVTTSQFPVIQAKFYALDANGAQIRPDANEIGVSEDGVTRTILSMTCPPPASPKILSSVMVIDVSGSMSLAREGVSNLDLAKTAATAWVQGLPAGKSECALTSFDDNSYLHQDFTTNRTRLLNALTSLQPYGGTNYNKGLLLPLAGGLEITKKAKFQRVIVFLTDGMPTQPPNTNSIIAEAQRQGCLIFAVTLGLPCPQSLKNICGKTGGQWFENITTVQQAEEVYRSILLQAQGSPPCEIRWERDVPCATGEQAVEFKWKNYTTEFTYTIPDYTVARYRIDPIALYLRSKPVGQRFDTTVTLTSVNSPFIVSDITSSNQYYDVNPKSFSLASGQSIELTISYTPPDSGFTWTEFEFHSTTCPTLYYASGGYPGVSPRQQKLQLVHPNGGELLVAGSDTVITWKGIPSNDNVLLEHSIDNGQTWKPVASDINGGSYRWQVPATPSSQCLVHVIQHSMYTTQALTLPGHINWATSAAWNADGSRVASADGASYIRVWDAKSDSPLQLFRQDGYAIHSIDWSPDGSKIAAADTKGRLWVWDIYGDTLIRKVDAHAETIYNVAWSPDGLKIATSSSDNTAKIWDATNGYLLLTLTGNSGLDWSPDGTKLATSTANTLRIWEANSGAWINNFSTVSTIKALAWSPTENTIAVATTKGTAELWDATTGSVLHTFVGHTGGAVNSVDWSPDGSAIVTGGMEQAIVWDIDTEQIVLALIEHTAQINCVKWSPDGNRIATASNDRTVKIWDLNTGLQADTSDATFSIVMPSPASHDVDMGRVLVNSAKDSVVQTFIGNIGTYFFNVRDIQITGPNSSEFSLVSDFPPFDVPANGTHHVEFRFQPASSGVKTAQVIIITQSDTLLQTIRGEGITPTLEVMGDIVDFGHVEIGMQKDTILALAIFNNGAVPIDFSGVSQLGPDVHQFAIISGDKAFTLAPGESHSVTLRFAPKFMGRTSGRIGFNYNGVGSPAIIHLFGQGLGGIVSVVDDSAYAGEERDITLSLQQVQTSSLQSVSASSFRTRIAYDGTLLYPRTGTISHGQRFDTVAVTGSIGTDNALARLPFTALLGMDNYSPLDIIDFEWLDASGHPVPYDVETYNGTFHLLGICEEGGTRLFNPTGTVGILKISPNPITDDAEIEIETIETGRTQISVIDMMGQEVATIYNGELSSGRHILPLNTSTLTTGSYYVQMSTPTTLTVRRMDILK